MMSLVAPINLVLYERRYGHGRKLPLAIMVSDDTMERTQDMLRQGEWFGMEEDQVTLMKQEKVAAIQVLISWQYSAVVVVVVIRWFYQ